MELDQFGFEDFSLMDEERLESALVLESEDGQDSAENPAVMLLTDKRVIHINGNGKHRKAVFASVQDVEAVEVAVQKEGNGSFIWAGLAFFVAFFLFFIIDNSLGRVAAPAVVALMGVYLIVDHLTSPGKQLVIFKTASTQLRADLKGDGASKEVYAFINRLFQLKSENGSDAFSRVNRFAPR